MLFLSVFWGGYWEVPVYVDDEDKNEEDDSLLPICFPGI